uniref:Uncharacterized protein n=1 Tax=Hyaloperonospora arabidopsidis (strain Emoy2) TaxID=559515 RepID=M4BF73_HYAAE
MGCSASCGLKTQRKICLLMPRGSKYDGVKRDDGCGTVRRRGARGQRLGGDRAPVVAGVGALHEVLPDVRFVVHSHLRDETPRCAALDACIVQTVERHVVARHVADH